MLVLLAAGVLAAAVALASGSAAWAAPPGGPKPGRLASVVLSPAAATVAPGGSQAYTVQGFDASGQSLGDVTGQATFTISAGGSCTGNVCTATTLGLHTVTGAVKKVTGTARLTAVQADLSIAQAVSNATPFYYAPVTFTTTVTNTSTTTTSAGVTVAVNVPAGLISPTVSTSVGSYDPSTGRWAVGSLVAGGTATLSISGDAAAVEDGAQTVTATVTATTFDPNTTNNTASASETSKYPPVQAVMSLAPGSSLPVNICASSPDPTTTTFDGSVLNAANPEAPASSVGNVSYTWGCSTLNVACPTPLNNITNSTFITYNNADFLLGHTYTVVLTITPDHQSEYRMTSFTQVSFTTTCIP